MGGNASEDSQNGEMDLFEPRKEAASREAKTLPGKVAKAAKTSRPLASKTARGPKKGSNRSGAKKTSNKTAANKAAEIPTGIDLIDQLPGQSPCTIDHYIAAVSAYVKQQTFLAKGPKKAAQIRLSQALGRALVHDLSGRIPSVALAHVGERKVGGGLRATNADVSLSHGLDGLRLAVELKPVNLAVGRAIWNRFGDLRTFAVNIHLKFPFAVIGGVLVIPTWEMAGGKAALEAELKEAAKEEGHDVDEAGEGSELLEEIAAEVAASPSVKKDTTHLIKRAVKRLIRAGGRETEADAAHLLEGIAVVAYDPDAGVIDRSLPAPGSGLRWEEFIEALSRSFEARFED